jgi:hypothetical protein
MLDDCIKMPTIVLEHISHVFQFKHFLTVDEILVKTFKIMHKRDSVLYDLESDEFIILTGCPLRLLIQKKKMVTWRQPNTRFVISSTNCCKIQSK